MIAVMQHHANGGEVEVRSRGAGTKDWIPTNAPAWDWCNNKYRIKPEQKKTKPVWFWKIKTKKGWFLGSYMGTEEEARRRWPNALEYRRMDMLGSEEVEV